MCMDITGMISLQSGGFFGGYYGGTIGSVLAAWEQAGVFSYMLPLLLLFALIYGILIQVKLFGGNKDATGRLINAIIALSVSLLSLQFDFVPRFFSEVFPRVGVGLAVLLLVLIFTGLFADPESKTMMYTMYWVGAGIVIIVLALTANATGVYSYLPGFGFNWIEWLPWVALIGLFVAIVAAGKEKKGGKPDSLLVRALKGN